MDDSLPHVLAHPLRDRLLFEYQAEPASASDVARRIGAPLNLVSYHTGILLRGGYIEAVGIDKRRGGMARLLRAVLPPYVEDEQWERTPPAVRRTLTRGLLLAISDRARSSELNGAFDDTNAHLSRSILSLDETGIGRVSTILRRVVDELAEVQRECDARGGDRRQQCDIVLMSFDTGGRAVQPAGQRAST